MKATVYSLMLVFLLSQHGLCQYAGNTVKQLDETRPADTESVAYGASAIREIKRAVRNAFANEHILSDNPLIDGTHQTNFFRSYMAGTNSIWGHAIITNSIPIDRIANVSNLSSLIILTNITSTAQTNAAGALSYTTTPTATSGVRVFLADLGVVPSNSTLLVETDVAMESTDVAGMVMLITNNALAGFVVGDATRLSHVQGRFYITPAPDTNTVVEIRAAPIVSGQIFINRGQGSANQTFGGTVKSEFRVIQITSY